PLSVEQKKLDLGVDAQNTMKRRYENDTLGIWAPIGPRFPSLEINNNPKDKPWTGWNDTYLDETVMHEIIHTYEPNEDMDGTNTTLDPHRMDDLMRRNFNGL